MLKRSPIFVKVFLVLVSLCTVVAFGLTGYLSYQYFLNVKAPRSAIEYEIAERTFIETYVLDTKTGGFNYWVERNGTVRDSKKYSLFQANMILWLGGIESQKHDEKNIELMKSAADYLVKYHYKGNGGWLEYDTSNHRVKQEFFWNPRVETYIAYALLQAYRVTGERSYLRVATETTKAQRTLFPDGKIMADYDSKLDIGYRFPEQLAHFEEYLLTSSTEAGAYAKLYDENYRGHLGKELLTPDGKLYYYHGMASFGQLLYGYMSGDAAAYQDGTVAREFFWSAQHDDTHEYNTLKPGENSDNGRDYHDKRIAMDLIEWSKQNDMDFRDDAVETWDQIKGFWDKEAPYGFRVSSQDDRKTCFTIGMPMMLMDLTPPKITNSYDTKTAFWNHQLSITVDDSGYFWNDVELRGIGTDSVSMALRVPWGFSYGSVQSKKGPCDTCVTYTANLVSPFGVPISFRVADVFGNAEWIQVPILTNPSVIDLKGWNEMSMSFYAVVLIAVGITSFTLAVIFYILSLRAAPKRTPPKT